MGASTSTLRELVLAGNLQALKNAVVEHGEQTINYELDSYGTTPLLLASRQFRPKIVAWLCENGADMTRKDGRGWTPLHWAAAAGDVGAAAALLDSGADSCPRDIHGRLPRHLLELAVCDANIGEIRERLLESELQTHGEATHSLAVPATVHCGRSGARIVIEVRAPEHHDESDYVQLYTERLLQGQFNREPPTPAQAMGLLEHNMMPRLGSFRYVAKGWRSVVVFNSEPIEVGLRLRAVYVRADGEVALASEPFVTTLAPSTEDAEESEPEWQLFISKSTGERYFVNTTTGESADQLPEGTPFGTDNVDGYASVVLNACHSTCLRSHLPTPLVFPFALPGLQRRTTKKTEWKHKIRRACAPRWATSKCQSSRSVLGLLEWFRTRSTQRMILMILSPLSSNCWSPGKPYPPLMVLAAHNFR